MKTTMRGASLVEVLVAMVVAAVGLVGLASAMLLAHRTQGAANLRMQVAWLAADMVERMRLNPDAAGRGAYDGDHYPRPDEGPACDAAHACGPQERAVADRAHWRRLLHAYLPATAHAAVACQSLAGPPAPGRTTCTLAIAWPETPTAMARLAWRFRP
jgi:type IV pilus modification protein PilV